MSERARQILERFPAHREAAGQGKLLGNVTEALSLDLDTLFAAIGVVRRSHRVLETPTLSDAFAIADTHGLGSAEFLPLQLRLEAILQAAAAVTDRASAAHLFKLFGVDRGQMGVSEGSELEAFGPEGVALDEAGAAARLALYARDAARYTRQVALVQTRTVEVSRIHALGNGTVRALLEGAASALDLALDTQQNRKVVAALAASTGLRLGARDQLFHSPDRYVHGSYGRDRFSLLRPLVVPPTELEDRATPLAQRPRLLRLASGSTQLSLGDLARRTGVSEALVVATAVERLQGELGPNNTTVDTVLTPLQCARVAQGLGYEVAQELPIEPELVGLEENPVRLETTPAQERHHAELFVLRRRGFGRAPMRATVTGLAGKTYGPMLVNRDEGRGFGFVGQVPDGQELVFDEAGHVLLSGADVTSMAYSFVGACFADALNLRPGFEFVFGDVPSARMARFVEATPVGALEDLSVFPSALDPVTLPSAPVGETRFAFFVRQAHLAGRQSQVPAIAKEVSPVQFSARTDETVFADATDSVPDSAIVGLSWWEHEGYVVRVVIPQRFSALDQPGSPFSDRVRDALERFRPAGVELRVEYLPPRVTQPGPEPDAVLDPIAMLRSIAALGGPEP